MTLRVLVVDDSRFYRNRVVEMLSTDPDIKVVDTAENGADGVRKAKEQRPDVITMDIEMPVMDGIQAVREIMKAQPTPILMFSSLTTEGAKSTLDALEAGALDFLPKRLEDISGDRAEVAAELCRRVKQLAKKRLHAPMAGVQPVPAAKPPARPAHTAKDLKGCRLIAIGASTGGPSALQTILTQLAADFPVPIVVTQHMPAAFTGPFATRLNTLCRVNVREAKNGDPLLPGTVLIAPGGKQMQIEKSMTGLRVKVRDGANEQYKPSVDITFASAAEAVGGGVLAVVLTGMGADGKSGAAELKKKGSSIWAQDEASCVVYGMPHAVVDAGLADRVLPLLEIGVTLARGS